MTRSPSGPRARSSARATGVAFAVAGLIVLADQLSKWAVRHEAPALPIEFGWGFGLHLVSNPGVSFGRLSGSGGAVLVAVAVLAAVLAVAVVAAPPRYRLALGVLLGGAAGNLIDRIRFGAVVDFVDVPWWPTFNVADAAIVLGVVLVLWTVLRGERA